MSMPVSVGGVRRMSNDTPPPQPLPPWAERETGLPAYLRDIRSQLPTPDPSRQKSPTIPQLIAGWATGVPAIAAPVLPPRDFSGARRPGTDTVLGAGLAMRDASRMGGAPLMSAGGQAPVSQMIGGGSGMSAPNYGPYREALIGQADALNARIQAMYNQLAEEAGANVERISGIYDGAGEGIGNVYDSATGNVEQAFGSAQQQAADQLARLGIEAAAPTVINPMALSQAQAVSGLEQGRASGQAANERFGSAASGFGSQMAQVAQQQGTEMNAAILGALQQRLNDSILMEEQGRMAARGGGGGGSASGLTPYQEAQLMAGREDSAINLVQWEQEQLARQQQQAVDLTFRLMETEGLTFTEAQAQANAIVSGQAPAAAATGSSGGGFWNWLNNPLW
jgi:hypothetical protein